MNGEEQFVEQVRRELDQRVEATPAHISSRLNAARHAALESRSRKRRQPWLPAMATTALLAVVVTGTWFSQAPEQAGGDPVFASLAQHSEDFDMLTGTGPLELYADAEFYVWLEQQELAAG